MAETEKTTISLNPREKEMAQKKSTELYGRVNLSGYISYLIRKDNKEALK
jgi:hypothetical protein